MALIRKILRYLGLTILALIGAALLVILLKTVQYKLTVSRKPACKNIESSGPAGLTGMVDPFTGTGGFPPYTAGDDMPGATIPFGMVRLSPDTRYFLGSYLGEGNTVSTAGYYYGDNRLMGFSHTRLVGTGASDGGHFRVLPSVGENACSKYINQRFTVFSHKNECASPGYYSLRLPGQGILAELTASEHTGIHRYTFTGRKIPHILIDGSSVLGDGKAGEGEMEIFPDSAEITGATTTFGSFSNRYGGIRVYFSAKFNRPFTSYSTWSGKTIIKNQTSVKGEQIGADLTFAQDEKNQVILTMGISYVSVSNARANRESETEGRDFSTLVAEAQRKWEDKLSLVKIEGGTDEQQRIFYTALYHSFQMPTAFCDVNGEYLGFDKKIHKAENFRYFTDLSLWDTFRTIHPLFTLLAPDDQRNMMASLVTMCKQGGYLPRWPSGGGYTGSMIGSSADIVIAESWLKGIRDFDVETAYQAMKKAALAIDVPKSGFRPRPGMDEDVKYGYCPAEKMEEAVSKTLEYAYADHDIYLLAKDLGHYEDTAVFADHSRFYRNLWNPETQYFQPRNSDGTFVSKFKPLLLVYLDPDTEYTDDYCEGSALQWRWALFFDGNGLVSLFRDKEYFINELNSFFENSNPAVGSFYPGPYYWHGNEPDIHAAYLFNYAGRPDLTQKWVRWILDNKYKLKYYGIDGDDDAGTLSAWYIFSALGFYPVAGSDIYQIGAPLFRKAEIKTGDKTFTIIADNYSPENKYVTGILLNDVPLGRSWLRHQEITSGGTLRFMMSDQPVQVK